VAPSSDEKIVEGKQTLAVTKSDRSQGDFPGLRLTIENVRDRCPCLIWQKRKKDTVKPARLGIHGHDRLDTCILRSVRDQAVLAQRHDDILLLKLKRRYQRSINNLHRHLKVQGPSYKVQGRAVSIILTLVVDEIAACVLDVELGLRTRVEALDQTFESRLARDEDELFEHGYFLT
jgi:hypothetical protein